MEIFLNAGLWGEVFAVPKSVVDNYIKLANEASVKVLLYVLRNSGKKLSYSEIASALNISESSVEEAFVFWKNANVFSEVLSAAPAENVPDRIYAPESKRSEKTEIKSVSRMIDNERNRQPSEIAERIEKSEEIRCLFSMTESAFCRPLTYTEQNSLIWMRDYLGLAADIILMIITYCISIEKASIKYIEKIACDWAEQGINTLESAQAEVKRLEESRSFNSHIMRAFCMNRRPTSKQQKFIDLWREKSYSLDLIEYAYEKTVENIDKLSFPYINSILEGWESQGLSTREMVDGSSRKGNNSYKDDDFDLEPYKEFVNNFGD